MVLFLAACMHRIEVDGVAASLQAGEPIGAPPRGGPPPGGPRNEPSGPWNSRLMVARSADGKTFARTGEVVAEQADVPDLVVSGDRLLLYYVGWDVDGIQNTVAVAVSKDAGATWSHQPVQFAGRSEGQASPVDPDVVALPDGRLRMYVTSDTHDGDGPRTFRAESDDGVTFTLDGVALAVPGRMVLDPTVVHVANRWLLFAGGSMRTAWVATSRRGRRFHFRGELPVFVDGGVHRVANLVAADGGWRMYTFCDERPHHVGSFFSSDGARWSPEGGARLGADDDSPLEDHGVKDPAVARLPDGSWLMVYATGMGPDAPKGPPGGGGPPPPRRRQSVGAP